MEIVLTPEELRRYSRHTLLPEFGMAGQEKLRAARVLLVGLGGLGSPSAMYLAAAGVGTLGLVEFDTVDESNLQRQIIHGTSDVGRSKIDSAAASVEFLKQLLELARDLVEAEKADEEGRLDDIKVVDPDKGALTQILAEYAPPDVPVIIETVVEKIDAIVRPVRGTGWQESQPGDREVRQQLRLVLKDSGLPPQGEIFDRAYAYVREHY